MRSMIDKVFKSLREFLGRLSKGQKIRLSLLAIVVVVLAIVVVSLMGRTTYGVLYPNLTAEQVGEIHSALVEMGVPTIVEGTTIKVPAERVSELRGTLAAEGYLYEGFNDDYLASASGFGITDNVQKEYTNLQYGANIDKLIMQLNKIQKSMTIVNRGEDSPFASGKNNSEATASVMLTIKGGASLTNAEANQIAEIVKGAVPGIKTENISIKDTNLTPYSIGDGNVDIGSDITSHFVLQNQLKQQIQNQVMQLLAPIYGQSNLAIVGSVTLDFDKVTTKSVEYAPPIAGETDGIVRSVEELYQSQRADGTASGIAGTDTNGVGGATEYPWGTLADQEQYNETLLKTNFEINETWTEIEKAQGTVKEMSMSVVINSAAVEEDYTESVTNLVSKALGLSEEYIAIEMLPLKDTSAEIAALIEAREAEQRQQQVRAILETVAKWGVVLLLGLSILSLLRMIIKNLGTGKTEAAAAIAGGGIDYIAGDDGGSAYSDVELNSKPSGVEQLEKFIDKDSRAVAQLLRNWLTDE